MIVDEHELHLHERHQQHFDRYHHDKHAKETKGINEFYFIVLTDIKTSPL